MNVDDEGISVGGAHSRNCNVLAGSPPWLPACLDLNPLSVALPTANQIHRGSVTEREEDTESQLDQPRRYE